MRDIDTIVFHCSASREGNDLDVEDMRAMHIKRGWADVGYHYIIKLDGTVQPGRTHSTKGAHVYGYNKNTLGVCYIGGLDSDGKPKDTRTDKQKEAMKALTIYLNNTYDNLEFKGHRDFSKDLDGDGVIEKHEWMKACPCFEVSEWINEIDI